MAEARLSDDYVGYRDAAVAILSRHDGEQAVSAYGLSDVFAEGAVHAPAYAFLEAEGWTTTSTGALSALALAGLEVPGAPAVVVPFGHRNLLAGTGIGPDATLVTDRPGRGLVTLPGAELVPHGGDAADGHVTVFSGDAADGDVLVSEDAMATYRDGVLARVRLGLSAELLGLASRLLDDAVAYARTRRQFGQAIGDFQAVQHLLAWAATEVHQLRSLYDVAVQRQALSGVDDLAVATAVKAVAGRVLLSVAQTAIQVTGAISFTWEYSLNRRHHRGLALDQLAGPSADLVAEVGRLVRTTGTVPTLFELADVTS